MTGHEPACHRRSLRQPVSLGLRGKHSLRHLLVRHGAEHRHVQLLHTGPAGIAILTAVPLVLVAAGRLQSRLKREPSW